MLKPNLYKALSFSLFALCGCHTAEQLDGQTIDSGAGTASDITTETETDWETHTDTTDTDTTNVETCAQVGGTCTEFIWEACPVNKEPYLNDQTLNCSGHCCLDAPPGYSCSESLKNNCVQGSQCPYCWESADDTSLSCQENRVCCKFVCY